MPKGKKRWNLDGPMCIGSYRYCACKIKVKDRYERSKIDK